MTKAEKIQAHREKEPKWVAHPKDPNRNKSGTSKTEWDKRWQAWRLTLDILEAEEESA